jgi:hypothetical protein
MLEKRPVSNKIFEKCIKYFDVCAKNRFKKGGKTDRIED